MDNEDDNKRYSDGSNGALNGNSSISDKRLMLVFNEIRTRIDNLYCDQNSIEEMLINLQNGRPAWHSLYESEEEWLEWGYPWVKRYLDEINS